MSMDAATRNLALALILLMGLAACGKKGALEPPPSAAPASPAAGPTAGPTDSQEPSQ